MSGTKELPAASKTLITSTELRICAESPAHHADAIEALFDRTFGPGHFAKTAERLREYNHSLPEFNRIALTPDGDIAGVCRVWPIWIETGGKALFFGPVAVAPGHRGEKLGLAVTRASIDAAVAAGWNFGVLIGHPGYFGEIGFEPTPNRFTFPGPQDQARVMSLALNSVGTNDYSGRVSAHPIY